MCGCSSSSRGEVFLGDSEQRVVRLRRRAAQMLRIVARGADLVDEMHSLDSALRGLDLHIVLRGIHNMVGAGGAKSDEMQQQRSMDVSWWPCRERGHHPEETWSAPTEPCRARALAAGEEEAGGHRPRPARPEAPVAHGRTASGTPTRKHRPPLGSLRAVGSNMSGQD
jgi:hypothetical protein